MTLTFQEQAVEAVQIIKDMFKDMCPIPERPADLTIDELWIMYCDKKFKYKTPGVENAVKLLLEDPRLCEIPIPMIAEIIREVFGAYGINCSCSTKSVRWYQSQRGMAWNIVRRKPYSMKLPE